MTAGTTDTAVRSPIAGGFVPPRPGRPTNEPPIYARVQAAPEARVALTVGYVIAVALVNPGAWAALILLASGAAAAVGIVAARSPLEPVRRRRELKLRLGVAVPVLGLAALIPFVATGPGVTWGPFTVSSTGLEAAATLALRSVTGILAATALSLSLPPESIAVGLGRLRMPRIMISIALLMLRYLSLTVEDWGRTRRSMTARGHDPRWLHQARPLASAAGALFIRTHHRGEQVHRAMVARGYSGVLPAPTIPRSSRTEWAFVAGVVVVATMVAMASRVVSG